MANIHIIKTRLIENGKTVLTDMSGPTDMNGVDGKVKTFAARSVRYDENNEDCIVNTILQTMGNRNLFAFYDIDKARRNVRFGIADGN